MDGIYLINKPVGPTSHDIVDRVRKITGERRVGHAGTLDPLADGLLIVLVGRENTKRQSEFLGLDKEYVAEVTFGRSSETYDGEGPFSEGVDTSGLEEEQVADALKKFVGEIEQTPPPHSAIKVGGERLYKKARRGEVGVIPKRQVTIHSADLVSFTGAVAEIKYFVSKGTYIRSLAHDLGKELAVGAYLSRLTRTKIGDHTLEDAQTLEEFEKSWQKK